MVMWDIASENLIVTQYVVLQMLYNLGNACAIAFDVIVTIGMSMPIPFHPPEIWANILIHSTELAPLPLRPSQK